jgi:hypothetical protein
MKNFIFAAAILLLGLQSSGAEDGCPHARFLEKHFSRFCYSTSQAQQFTERARMQYSNGSAIPHDTPPNHFLRNHVLTRRRGADADPEFELVRLNQILRNVLYDGVACQTKVPHPVFHVDKVYADREYVGLHTSFAGHRCTIAHSTDTGHFIASGCPELNTGFAFYDDEKSHLLGRFNTSADEGSMSLLAPDQASKFPPLGSLLKIQDAEAPMSPIAPDQASIPDQEKKPSRTSGGGSMSPLAPDQVKSVANSSTSNEISRRHPMSLHAPGMKESVGNSSSSSSKNRPGDEL